MVPLRDATVILDDDDDDEQPQQLQDAPVDRTRPPPRDHDQRATTCSSTPSNWTTASTFFFLVHFLHLLPLARAGTAAAAAAATMVDASRVVVSVAVDAASLEIQYEAIRMLTSLRMNGGTLRDARVAVCISHTGDDPASTVDPQLVTSLAAFSPWSVVYSPRYSLPSASPSLNKLCAFNPPGLRDDDYLLYLDADIFVADDPLPLLTKHAARADIVCGRPWNTFEGMQDFFEFVALPTAFDDDRYPLLESYAGGLTFYGLCNSGMYFMPSAVAVAMKYGALAYLLKAQTDPNYRDRDPYAPSNFGIDSIVLWAAQYSLNFTVDIAPTALNFMAPVEKYMPRFLRLDADEAAAEAARAARRQGMDVSPEGSGDVTEKEAAAAAAATAAAAAAAAATRPVLAHFSRGSEFYVEFHDRTLPSRQYIGKEIDVEAAHKAAEAAGTAGTATTATATAAVDGNGDSQNVPAPAPAALAAPVNTSAMACVVVMRGHLEPPGESLLLPLVWALINNETACRVYGDALFPFQKAVKKTALPPIPPAAPEVPPEADRNEEE